MVSFFDGIAFLEERGIRDARSRFFAVEGAKERGGEQEDLAFFREADQEEGNAPLGEDGFEMLDLLKGDVREGEGGRALGLLCLEIDVMPPINAVIVRRRLGLVERVGDLGSLRVIDVYDLDGSRAFRDEAKAFFSIMRVGFVDRGFKSHAAVPRGDFSLGRNG